MSESTNPPTKAQVLVIGGGLAGLSCARLLHAAGVDVHLLEGSDGIGGRVRTDELDGFLLDRGFQVLLTAYEEVQSQVELETMDLRPFRPGSLIWDGTGFQHLSDPFRDPASAASSLRAKVGSLKDKLGVANLRRRLMADSPSACFQGPEGSTQEELEALGFSPDFIDTFFRPFLGGVFLERALETSASLFRYYFRCFSSGDASLPNGGMVRLPEGLARSLEGRIHLNAPVVAASGTSVTLAGGRTLEAERVVLAVDGLSAAGLLGEERPGFKAAVTSYFSAPEAPTDKAMLILDGQGTGPANHVAVLSNVAPGYAPDGLHLVSVSGVDGVANDPEAFRGGVRAQLRSWFGPGVDRWDHLRTYHIPQALPRHPAGSLPDPEADPVRPDGLVMAGDHTVFGAIQGALFSGRRAAEAVLGTR